MAPRPGADVIMKAGGVVLQRSMTTRGAGVRMAAVCGLAVAMLGVNRGGCRLRTSARALGGSGDGEDSGVFGDIARAEVGLRALGWGLRAPASVLRPTGGASGGPASSSLDVGVPGEDPP